MIDVSHSPANAKAFEAYRRDGDPAKREELATQYLPLARHLARRYRGRAELDDLEQVASLALLKAIDRFDPARGLEFSTFAFPTILGELKRYFRDHGWTVRVPRDLQELTLRLDSLRETLTAGSAHHPDSLDRPLSDDGDPVIDTLAAQADPGFAHTEDAAVIEGLL